MEERRFSHPFLCVICYTTSNTQKNRTKTEEICVRVVKKKENIDSLSIQLNSRVSPGIKCYFAPFVIVLRPSRGCLSGTQCRFDLNALATFALNGVIAALFRLVLSVGRH